MEMALNMGAFEALDNREMMEVDGGWAQVGKIFGEIARDEAIIQTAKLVGNYVWNNRKNVRGYNFLCR